MLGAGIKIWGKPRESRERPSGVARGALAGASRGKWLQDALQALVRHSTADRIGIWLEPEATPSLHDEFAAGFHGRVWDRHNPDTPREWVHLSVEPPLPDELLLRGKTVELDLDSLPGIPILGLLAGLRHALWVPVAWKEQLKGVILWGSFEKTSASSRELVEMIAAELSLALGLEESERSAARREADLELVRNLLPRRDTDSSSETALLLLVDSCTRRLSDAGGLGAAFAVIGSLGQEDQESTEGPPIEFLWRSGEDSLTRAIESEPLCEVWRRSLQTGKLTGSEREMSWIPASVVRLVALPLESEGGLLGILVAGLPPSALSLQTLERLELRAGLAASLLRQRSEEQEAIRQSHWQRDLLESLSEPFALLDEAGRISTATRGARELMRGDLPIAERPSLPEIFRRHQQARVAAWWETSLKSEAKEHRAEPQPLQAELYNGTEVRLSLHAPAQGQPAILRFESPVAREMAGQAELELQSVIEWLEEGVLLFDSHDNIRAMNRRFEQIVGLTPEESGKFKTLEALLARMQAQAAEPARFASRWRELAAGIEGGMREEFHMLHPSPRVLERAARPILDPIGRLLGRVEIYVDLTAQRVFHSKLLQTEKLAALGQMVSGVAHELSNPLTSISGYAHRLLARQDLPGRAEEVRQIYQEAERASAILRELLVHARETIPERRLVSLNQVVQRAMDLQRFGLAAEKIRLEIDLDPVLPFIEGDPGHLQQVLMNLVGNARQAIEQHGRSGGTIRLSTRRIGEHRVSMEVADNGPGIPQAILSRIFDPFFTTKPVGVGTGLGLAIVLSVVREHGGQVHVSSPPQGGAVFKIEFPAAAETVQGEATGSFLQARNPLLPTPAEMAPRENSRAAFSSNGKSGHILVVEDEPTVARLIADVLEDEGMQVDVLMDGREALDRAARETYDLVICDMRMPGLDGQHFYRSLERTGNPLRNRFLFVTGDIVAAQTREFLERNHLPHVAKPFRVEELTEKVHGVLAVVANSQALPEEAARKNVVGNG